MIPALILRSKHHKRQISHEICLFFGAGDGNRTRVASLEGWSSAIELHPQNENGAVDGARTRDLHLGKVALYQLSYYRM